MPARPSLRAVATAVGVSPATVSNAYNRPDQLSGALRERIFDVAATIGYAGPDPTASSLRSRRTGAVGVLFAQELAYAFDDPYLSVLLAGVAETVTAAGSNLLLMPVGPHRVSRRYSRSEEVGLLQGVRRAAVDGVVADGVHASHPALRVLSERGVPLVSTTEGVGDGCVLVDDHAAGRALAEHLRSLGHVDVTVLVDSTDDGQPVVDPLPDALLPYARLRLDGFRAGLEPGRATVLSAGANTRSAGRRAARRALAAIPRPTAIAATTDVLALAVLDEMRDQGLRPGTDVSVTGFDDVAPAARAGLTTVRQPVREKGRAMGRMLLDPAPGESREVLTTELVVRSSTGPSHRGE